MKLIKLILRNFKGIKDFELDAGGEDVDIYGDNGTGKTTIADAWFWLLFGKDSLNRADFEIKTLDSDGVPIPGLEHEVEGTLDLDGKPLTLKKVYQEIWTKKRGLATKEFTGHTTDHFIDGVPIKKGEYETKIASIVDEDAFKLLTNPRYFNEVIHWQERRRLLMQVCGDVSDEDVIAYDSRLAELPEILNGRKLEDHRKVIAARRTEINKEIEKIPVRISEVQRGLPEAIDAPSLKTELDDLKERRNTKAQELANLEAGGGIAEKTKKLREVEAEMLKVQREHWTALATGTQTVKVQLRGLQDSFNTLGVAVNHNQRQIEDNQEILKRLEGQLEQRRADWHFLNNSQFTYEDSDVCPTCGQPLPPEQVTAARDKALENFNLAKAKDLESSNFEGKALNAEVAKLQAETTKLEQDTADKVSQQAEIQKQINETEVIVASLERQEQDYASTPAYIAMAEKKAGIEMEIAQLKARDQGPVEALRLAISAIDNRIADCEATLARIQQRENGLRRIEELKTEEKKLLAEFEKLEHELYLAEQFIRTKVTLLEGRINSKFTMARFKMFNQLVNGGIEECCETTYLGIPYSSALNNSARINIGLDIINTLSEHFQFVAPIWIDNREAITKMTPMKGQVISLIVTEPDKRLRVKRGREAVAA